jgi:sialate O-acetylesterase
MKHIILYISLFLGCHQVLMADIRLPSVICDGMVIQQGIDVPVWGWSKPGQRVQIESDGRRW